MEENNNSYDEDISKNSFLAGLKSLHPDLFDKICIPNASVVAGLELSLDLFNRHILLEDESTAGRYMNLNNQLLIRSNEFLMLHSSCDEATEQPEAVVRILFEETHILSDEKRFKVFCVSALLIPKPVSAAGCENDDHILQSPPTSAKRCSVLSTFSSQIQRQLQSTYTDEKSLECYEIILFGDGSDAKFRQELDRSLKVLVERVARDFRLSRSTASGPQQLSDFCKEEFFKIWTRLCQIRFTSRGSEFPESRQIELFRLAVEVYFFNYLHDEVWLSLATLLSDHEENFNCVLNNLFDLEAADLGVDNLLLDSIPNARRELKRLNLERSPYAKLLRLRKVLRTLNDSVEKGHSKESNRKLVLNPDTLLPVLAFLILKSGVYSWAVNIYYMQHFNFCTSSTDELSYCLASFEAAVQYLKTSCSSLKSMLSKYIPSSIHHTTVCETIEKMRQRLRNSESVSAELEAEHGVEAFWALVIEAIEANAETTIRSLFSFRRISESHECWAMPMDGSRHASFSSFGSCSQRSDPQECSSDEISSIPVSDLSLCHPLCLCETCRSKQKFTSFININSVMHGGRTALHLASVLGKARIVDVLCALDADPNIKDDHGQSPLHLACRGGYQHCVLLLLHFGALPKTRDVFGNTSLHVAVQLRHTECVKALLFYHSASIGVECRSFLNMRNANGETCLHIAARMGYFDLMSILLENGINSRLPNLNGELAADLAESLTAQNLIRTRFSTDHCTEYVETDDLNGQGDDGYVVKVLDDSPTRVAESADAKQVNKLLKAVAENSLNTVRFLLGVPFDASEEQLQQLMNVAVCHPLCQCEKCFRKCVGDVLNINGIGTNELSALHIAASLSNVDMVKMLLQLGADVHLQAGALRRVPLHHSVAAGRTEISALLLQHGANANDVDRNGSSCLHLAAELGNQELVQLLVQNGSLVNLVDNIGNTPLHEAAKSNHLETVVLLLNAGARKGALNDVQLLPVDLATNKAVITVLKL